VAAFASTSALAPLAAAWVMACAKLPAFPASNKHEKGINMRVRRRLDDKSSRTLGWEFLPDIFTLINHAL
jgi:hypothetical protein